jgi:hypothetical protein
VTDILDPAFDANSTQGKAIADTLRNSFNEDILTEYIARLQNDFGVTVNEAAFNQVVGGGGQQ